MTPAEIVAALPVLAQLGGAIEQAVVGLVDAIRAEAPELLGPLPPGLPEVDAARAEAVERIGSEGGA